MSRRPRQADVAALAGVSPAIVSIVLNGRSDSNVRISPDTQQRVWEAIRKLGYVANPVARKLRGGQNRLLGVFTYQSSFPLAHDDHSYPFLMGIEEEAQAQDYDLLLFTRPPVNGKRSIFKDGVNSLQLADGAILLGHNRDSTDLTRLMDEGFPFVHIGRRDIPGYTIPYIAADNIVATRHLVEYVIQQGHRHIAYVHRSDSNEPLQDRITGYYQALQHAALQPDAQCCEPGDLTVPWIQQQLSRGVTAFITENNFYARKIIEVAAQSGKHAPRDFSYAIAGDLVDSDGNHPEITSYRLPRQEIGQRAARLLIELITHPDNPGEELHAHLPCIFNAGQTVRVLYSENAT